MKKYLFSLLMTLAIFCQPSLAQAGTCNASYANTLPQTSGSIGALPPDMPGQTPLGYITHIEATGGPTISFTYTPTVGSPVISSISFGASSGISCTSNQAGGFTGPKVYGLNWANISGTMNTQLIINGSTAPDHVLTCTGMTTDSPGNGNIFTSNDGLQKVWTGPDSQKMGWGGYNTVTGLVRQSVFDMNGSCRVGTSISSPSFQDPTSSMDTYNIPHLQAYGSGGITSVQFFVDGVSKGTDSSFPYDIIGSSLSTGRHDMYVIATFPQGTAKASSVIWVVPVKVSVGGNFACTTNDNGDVLCWGDNTNGKLGANSNLASSSTPLLAAGTLSFAVATDVSAGLESACAVHNGGVSCWGNNSNGILGVLPATTPSSKVPLQVIAQLSGVTDVEVGGGHACALFSTGTVKCWGLGSSGQLANGSYTATNITPVVSATGVSAIAVARNTSYFKIGTALYASGDDTYGQLGNGSPLAKSNTVVNIIASGVQLIWGGVYHACAHVSGVLYCWGSNYTGEASNGSGGTGLTVNAPAIASSWSGMGTGKIAGGDGVTCAVLSALNMKCLGYNASGQLGLNFTSSMELVPQQATGYSSNMIDISAGYHNVCAYQNGIIKCAGDNTYGQIGNSGASNPQLTPMAVIGAP